MLEKKWILKPQPSSVELAELKSAINASDILATLLVQRKIQDFESARAFFNPVIEGLHNPFLMKDMDRAVNRISNAIEEGENILIYGDYDVDGTSAVSLVYGFLMEQYENVGYYIPDRYGEGYGVSYQGIDFADDNGFSLVIALDCGVKANEQIAYALDKKIEFIVCDHHLPSDDLPMTTAMLNPLQKDCDYPYKYLSGCGIGYKLIQALSISWGLEKELAWKQLDLVAIAAACDIVPITGENRILVNEGAKLMSHSLRPGLNLLLENAGMIKDGELTKKVLTVTDLVFKIGPRINAAGRMQHGQLAVELLTANTMKGAEEPAKKINLNNQDRREVDLQILDEALEMINTDPEQAGKKSTMLYAEHWHKGVIGIVASRIQEHFYKPTIILTEANGKASGSARSVNGFDIHESIEQCSDLLLSFGGHPAAAGMTLDVDKVDDFRSRFEKSVADRIKPDQLVPTIEIDAELSFNQITSNLFNTIERMSPFGPDNMKPFFVSYNVKDTGKSKCVGDGTHLKFDVVQEGLSRTMRGIGFGLFEFHDAMKEGKSFDLVYTLEENTFNGRTNIEMMVKDVKINDE